MQAGSAKRRVVLLGASNVVRGLPMIVSTARSMWSEPIEIMVAMGHGRSYGQDSTVLGRKISGIFPCALWQDLQTRDALPTVALLTDIGNDLLYGTSAEQLLDWVDSCIGKLTELGATTIVTQLPSASIERLGERRFRFFRRLLFPCSNLTLEEARHAVCKINGRLAETANMKKSSVIPVSGAWYGVDPIHIMRCKEREAWPTILSHWRTGLDARNLPRRSISMTAYCVALAPKEWSQWGVSRVASQPCGRFADGTTISLY